VHRPVKYLPSALLALLLLCAASSATAQDASPSSISANVPATAEAPAAVSGPAPATAPAAAAAPAPSDEEPSGEELAKKLNNPISDLVSVPFQFNWENGIGAPDRTRFILNIQPVMPFALNDKWNLIMRIVAPIEVSQPPVTRDGIGTSGVSDPLVSFFLSPAQGSIIWGVGPAISLPSTNDPTLGSQKWAAGPTFVVLKQDAGWTVGMLGNQVWSFAGAPDRPEVSQMFLQPFVVFTTKSLWTFVVNSETTANWEVTSPDRWNTPMNLEVSKLSTFGPFPASYEVGWGYFFASPEHEFGATWKVRGAITILLPEKKKKK
jgi:hypothetical protein